MTSTAYYHRQKRVPVKISGFVTIGTPFDLEEDEALKRSKPVTVEEMTVRDDMGRRRFHGAFTGGFSAGYFNTVGSVDGWTPTTFVSSRSDRNEQTKLSKPEDFMDEEDLAEYGIAPKKLSRRDEYGSIQNNDKSQISDIFDLKEYQMKEKFKNSKISLDDRIGIKLLKNIGWKEGKGVGELVTVKKPPLTNHKPNDDSNKKIYGCALPPHLLQKGNSASPNDEDGETFLLLPHDSHIHEPEIRKNLFGIGYVPIRGLRNYDQRNSIEFKPTGNESRGIKGEAFGTGVIEDEGDNFPAEYNDVYTDDNLENYVFSIGNDHTNKNKATGTSGDELKFIKSTNKCLSSQFTHGLPHVPRDFKPCPVLGNPINESIPKESKFIDPMTKALMLGTIDPKEYIERRTHTVTLQNPNIDLLRKFGLSNKVKQFVKAEKPDVHTIDSSTDAENSHEKLLKQESTKKAVLLPERKVLPWLPERVLCKRFNVPYISVSEIKTTQITPNASKLEFYAPPTTYEKEIIVPQIMDSSEKTPSSASFSKSETSTDNNTKSSKNDTKNEGVKSEFENKILENINEFEDKTEKPPIDLFKSVFSDED